jgi:hypothetical protein
MAMKKILLILIMCITISSFAQSYKPCLDGEIIRWSFIDQRDCDGPVKTTEIVAFGDAILNDIAYKKLYIDESFNFPEAEETNTNWKNHVPQLYYQWENMFIRESEDASKLYIYNSNTDEEYLISDINLDDCDTFQFFTAYFGTIEEIVDSVYFKNELKHLALHFFGYNQYDKKTLTFIESVGSEIWYIYPAGCNPDCWGLNCFQNQTFFYKNNRIINDWNFAECVCGYYGQGVGINTISEDNYNIFIQKEQIEIFFTSEVNANISIYDIQGKQCYTKDNISDNKFTISTGFLPKGVYILSILNKENHQINSKKIVLY